ncbi:MAG: FmdB family zinc ribbon protein [Myxococcota bacterium]
MPIYEYKCEECNRIFEYLVRNLHDTENIKCEYCGSRKFKRVMSSYSAFGSSSSGTEFSGSEGGSSPSCGCGGGSCGI